MTYVVCSYMWDQPNTWIQTLMELFHSLKTIPRAQPIPFYDNLKTIVFANKIAVQLWCNSPFWLKYLKIKENMEMFLSNVNLRLRLNLLIISKKIHVHQKCVYRISPTIRPGLI